VEWCFSRSEDGKFGDQKYLDDWPERFGDKVHVLQHQEWTLAPWNATRFPYGSAIIYHFHGLRLLDGGKVSLSDYAMPPAVVRNVYEPYLGSLKKALATLKGVGFSPVGQGARPGPLARSKRLLYGVYSHLWRARLQNYRKI
jgi:hypothetical protein